MNQILTRSPKNAKDLQLYRAGPRVTIVLLAAIAVLLCDIGSPLPAPAHASAPAAPMETDVAAETVHALVTFEGPVASMRSPAPSWVRIQHRLELPPSAHGATRPASVQSGTAVGPHTVLTHGHYRPFGDPSYLSETMVITLVENDPLASEPIVPQPVDAQRIARPYADAGTTLLVLPDDVRLPPAAPLGDPSLLAPGDRLFVVHWKVPRFKVLETTILQIEGRVACLEDPERLIKVGDSGDAVYNVRGELVGNVWSIGVEGGKRLPWIEVALLPEGIEGHIR